MPEGGGQHAVTWTQLGFGLGAIMAFFGSTMALYVVPEIRAMRDFREEQKVMSERRTWQIKEFDEDLAEMRGFVMQSAGEVNKLTGRLARCEP